jgi:hypothetical protein
MAQQQFLIDGVNYTSYLTTEGLKWTRNDIDASGVGRDKSGTMRRRRIATKVKLRFTCRDLTHSEMLALNQALFPETVDVTYLDPRVGMRTATFYGSSVEAATLISQNGETLWGGASFSLVEV